MGESLAVIMETAPKRSFASALDWPGWSRGGRSPEAALEDLAAYADRYAVVAAAAGLRLPGVTGSDAFTIAEEVAGNATTEFGAPAIAASVETSKATPAGGRRVAALLEAAWTVFDDVVSSAPAALRKGPRGGGRDRDAMVDHVLGAEHAFAGKIGVRLPQPRPADIAARDAVREAILSVVRADRSGVPARAGGWSPRYAARRLAWHALDHAWEMQDRSSSG
jgi:hypothetical protein